jgi:tRNA(fMet)-specific endonuclease VapC
MWRYLLDTNILSAAIRNPVSRLARRITRLGQPQVCTSIIVAAELRYGAAKSGSARLVRRVDELLTDFDVLPLQAPADAVYAQLRARLESTGTLIGPHDFLIAAHTLALDLVLVTDNEREFSRVPGLRIENWLR